MGEPVFRAVEHRSDRIRVAWDLRGGDGNRTRVEGFAGPCLNHSATPPKESSAGQPLKPHWRRPTMEPESRPVDPDGVRRLRADDGIRTRDPHLGKVMLYQLSHVRISGPEAAARWAVPGVRTEL